MALAANFAQVDQLMVGANGIAKMNNRAIDLQVAGSRHRMGLSNQQLLAMELSMEQSEVFCLTLPARYRNLKVISHCIELLLADLPDLHQQEQVIYGIKLAVHEVANNAIEHAYGHEQGILEISLHFDRPANRFTAHLHDMGAAFDAAGAPTPDLDVPHESGYGLFLAEQLMDEVIYERQADGNHWRLVKQLS